ncbi:MAG: hypothetical protein FJZ90_17440, partial [Chloroflexi bacterium]|nr:hypothetical protein [Chloroflexota bacterium]
MRRTGPYLLFLLLAATALAWQLGRNPAREAREIAQERFDYAVPPLDAGHTVGQTFVSRQAGLKAVELLLVRYQPDRALPPEAHLILALERLDDAARPPVTVTLSAAGMTHNQRLRFAFPPLADSRDAAYRFTLSTDGDHGLGFWACSSDAYADGTLLSDGQEAPGDIYFTTHYDYALRDALSDGLRLLARHGRKLPALFLLLGLPGIVASLYLLPPRRLEIGVYLALVLALSMAAWPLLLLWTSLLGLSLAGWRAWIVVLALIAAGAYRLWRRPGLSLVDWSRTARDPLPELALALILLLAWGVRLLQVRELVVPAWVDSVHHTLITQLISERGRVPSTLEPYLPLGDFHYHYGFHALAAVLTWLGGLSSDAAVLLLGQALNALAALPLYALASEWAGRRWAGVGAALVAGALSYMPAYYVSWGRYTQLAGLNLLPLACLLTGWLLGGERRPLGLWAMALLLLGGLMVTHYRVLVFYAAFWVIYAPLYLWRARTRDGVWWDLARVGVALAVGALVLTAPWSARFAARILPRVDTIYGGWAAAGDPDTALPMGLLKVGWTPRLLYLAAAGAVWALLRRRGEMLLVPLWVGLCLLVANLHLLGLPTLWLIHNESVVISFWLPVGLLCGWVLGDLVGLLAELWAR